jgi:hypothetical protein
MSLRVINRTAVSIVGAQPYIDWMRSRDADFAKEALTVSVAHARSYGTAVLLPEFEDEAEVVEWIEDNYEWLFEFQLASWTGDELAWPANRTLKMFREWFRLDIHSVVVDVGEDDIEGEEL